MTSTIQLRQLIAQAPQALSISITPELNKRISLVALTILAVALVVIGVLTLSLRRVQADIGNYNNHILKEAIRTKQYGTLTLSNLMLRAFPKEMISKISGHTFIEIKECPDLKEISTFPQLTGLTVEKCPRLEVINLSKVESLSIYDCDRLDCLIAPVLEELTICVASSKEVFFPKRLECPKLSSLELNFSKNSPQAFLDGLNQYLKESHLTTIKIRARGLESLDYIDNLPSKCKVVLDRIKIKDFNNLTLPDCIKKLDSTCTLAIHCPSKDLENWKTVLEKVIPDHKFILDFNICFYG